MTVAPGRLGLMAALLLGGERRCRLDSQRRSGMQRSLAAKATGSRAAWSAYTGATHDGLAGTDRAAINRLAWHGRGTTGRHSRTRRWRLGLAWRGTGLLLQPGYQIGTRGHDGTSGRLAGQIRTRGRRSNGHRRRRCSRSWSGRCRWSRFGRRRSGARDRLRSHRPR